MRRVAIRIALAVAAAAAASAIAWAVYGSHAFIDTFEILAPLGVATVLVGEVIATLLTTRTGTQRPTRSG